MSRDVRVCGGERGRMRAEDMITRGGSKPDFSNVRMCTCGVKWGRDFRGRSADDVRVYVGVAREGDGARERVCEENLVSKGVGRAGRC